MRVPLIFSCMRVPLVCVVFQNVIVILKIRPGYAQHLHFFVVVVVFVLVHLTIVVV